MRINRARKSNIIRALRRENYDLKKENDFLKYITKPTRMAAVIDRTNLKQLRAEYFVSERYTAAIIAPGAEEIARKELGYKLFEAIHDGTIKIYERKDEERRGTVYGVNIWVE